MAVAQLEASVALDIDLGRTVDHDFAHRVVRKQILERTQPHGLVECVVLQPDCVDALRKPPLRHDLVDDLAYLGAGLVNGPSQVYVERHGRLELSDCQFTDDAGVMAVIERIVAPLGRRIDESQPYVDARLSDGSRVNAIIAPLSL
ncbi:MAG: Flp pilus assembly complex ATPase component TadA, partial [Bacteroidales bacterium]|nr:Flp pilus assembly complex ATPase component TadA [Bacteroidales bacterium]